MKEAKTYLYIKTRKHKY